MPSEKTRGGLIGSAAGAYWQHAHTHQQRPSSPALCRNIVDCNIFMSTHKRIVA
nr:MAG TPA: hypothetical protein [Caudoviricetes sp.]